MFCATGPLEASGLSSQVAMQTLYYTGRDKGDQETPLVSEATSATGIYAPSQPIFVILFIANIHYPIPSQELIWKILQEEYPVKFTEKSSELEAIMMSQSV